MKSKAISHIPYFLDQTPLSHSRRPQIVASCKPQEFRNCCRPRIVSAPQLEPHDHTH